jgi:hypothetical protein
VILDYRTMKWALFLLLLFFAPALLFMIQVFMIVPAIFFLAGIFFVMTKFINPASFFENLAFIAFLAIHLLIFGGLYYLIAMLLAKLTSLIKPLGARTLVFFGLCCAAIAPAFFPLYGSGGHGPAKMGNLLYALEEVDRSYGPMTSLMVYGGALLAIAAITFWRRRKSGNN